VSPFLSVKRTGTPSWGYLSNTKRSLSWCIQKKQKEQKKREASMSIRHHKSSKSSIRHPTLSKHHPTPPNATPQVFVVAG
jgi:hypothetical protein